MLKAWLKFIILGWVNIMIGAWALMVAVGIAHAEWIPALPTVSFWTSAVIVVLFGIAVRVGIMGQLTLSD